MKKHRVQRNRHGAFLPSDFFWNRRKVLDFFTQLGYNKEKWRILCFKGN